MREGLSGTIYSGSRVTDQEFEMLEISRKIRLLLHHYGLETPTEGNLAKLALLLARDWVPGFEVLPSMPRGKGRPKVVTDEEYLVSTVDRYLYSNPHWTVREACRNFKTAHNSEARWTFIDARRVENLYYESVRAVSRKHEKVVKQQVETTMKVMMDMFQRLSQTRNHK